MGSTWSVQPDGDPRLAKAMKTFMLTSGELGSLKETFNGLDKNRTGYIDMDDFFKSIDYKRNSYTDGFMDLLGIENDEPVLSFTDYVLVVCSYCLFEVPEILRFCMFIFDQDKQVTSNLLLFHIYPYSALCFYPSRTGFHFPR